MENEKVEKYISEKILKDFNNHLSLEQKLLSQVKTMEQNGLQTTIQYKRLVGIKTEQSYFVCYLYRLLEFLNSDNNAITKNSSPKDMKIKNMIQIWKKTDYKFIRKMRKGIGDDGVTLMKNSVDKSILKVNEYIVDLVNNIKEL